MTADVTATAPLPKSLRDILRFDETGLIPAIARSADDGEVLMLAWMNAESLSETLASGEVCYWSRSRGELWHKGETSGQKQRLIRLRIDCDGDALVLDVEQIGVACHTGRRSCFFSEWDRKAETLREVYPVAVDPKDLYGTD